MEAIKTIGNSSTTRDGYSVSGATFRANGEKLPVIGIPSRISDKTYKESGVR
jgi:hypothetical protein